MQLAVVWVRSGVHRCHPNLNLFRILFLERTPPSPRKHWVSGCWLLVAAARVHMSTARR